MALASALRFAGRFEEAILQAKKALDLDPGHLVAYLNLGHNYLGLGRLDEAIEAFRRHGPSGNLGDAYARAGRTDEARALLAQFERRYADTGFGAGHIAQIYCGLGEIDRAFEWIDRMDRFQTRWPTTYKVAPVWNPLRSDPRFHAVLKKYGLAD
jgi:tetratricopeptide (TPR) repeat protein